MSTVSSGNAINISNLGSAASQNGIDFSAIAGDFTKYIVTPANAFGLGGFVFDVEGATTIDLMAEITDHYLEDNNTVQDQIAIKPQRITLKSYVGELVFRTDNSTNTPLQTVVQKLTTISSYLPSLAAGAQQVQSSLSLASQAFTTGDFSKLASASITPPGLNNLVDLWALTKNLNPASTKQQQAYLYFKALFQQKILTSVQTPFEFVTNLAIERITATQDETTKSMSDFSITLKKINTVAVATVSFDPTQYQNRASQQAQPVSENGNNQGASTLVSDAWKLANWGGLVK